MTKSPSESSHPVEWRGDDSLGVYYLRIEGIEDFYFKFINSPEQRETIMINGEDSFVLKGNFSVEYRNFVESGLSRGLTPKQIFEECLYFYEKNPAFQIE